MLLLGLSLGGYAWWVQFRKGRQILQFWGPRPTYLIRHGDRVELLRFAGHSEESPSPAPPDADKTPETVEIGGQSLRVASVCDITDVRGLVHARHTLVVDMYYVWGDSVSDCKPQWTFALRFSDQQAGDHVTLVFAPNCDRVRLLEENREIQVMSGLSDALRERSIRWFDEGKVIRQGAPKD